MSTLPRKPGVDRLSRLPDLLARASVAGLFLALVLQLTRDFLESGRITGLLLLLSELLAVILIVIRRPAVVVDLSWLSRLVTGYSIIGPLFLRPAAGPGLVPDLWTGVLLAVGLMVEIWGKMTLGRSFGLVPANRQVICNGPYRYLRHPIYAGYVMTHVAFLIAHPTSWNALVLLTGDASLLLRAMREERVLIEDPLYASYSASVRWRVLPGVF